MALCTVLRSPIFNLSDKELQVLLASGALVLMAKLKTNHPEIFGQLIKLRSLHRLETMSNIIGYLLTTHKITERYEFAFGPVEGPLARANILKWFDMVRSKSAEEALDAQSWALAMDDAAEEDETGNAALAANAVSLMTIHKSKGLEFPCVIVTDLASDWHKPDSGWVKDTRPGREGLWYIGTEKTRPRSSPMLKELLAINEADSRFEKARLLYVALTRASTHLVITGAKPKKPSEEAYYHQVAAAAKNLAEMIPRTINDDGIMYTRGQIDETITPDKPEETAQTIINSEPTVFESRPALLILNPSKKSWIDAPDSVPTNAGESKSALLADPQPFSPELGQAFGTLVHKLIENHILKISWSDRRLLRLIPTSLSPDHDLDFNEFLQIAKSDVANLLQSSTWQQLLADAKDLFTEIPLAGIIGEDFINAKADLILRDHDGNITVVDFKTIALKSNPSDDAQLKSLCRDLGYTEQVSQYCQLAQAAFKAPRSRGLVLFTRNRQMIEMCVHALQVP
jgi:ATP-dependent helicase/nuclease subunit A